MIEPGYWTLAAYELSQTDTTMARLIANHPQGSLQSRGDAFTTLARAITGQQISVKAADTVWQRLLNITEITPLSIAALSAEQIRQCGYSLRKVTYLHDLAQRFANGSIDPSAWTEMDDQRIIAALTQIHGIGQWSAEMVLMFNLLRPDVLPLDDIGLQRAIALHYPDMQLQGKAGLRKLGESWRPWRSVATWYLWRSLDPVAVAY